MTVRNRSGTAADVWVLVCRYLSDPGGRSPGGSDRQAPGGWSGAGSVPALGVHRVRVADGKVEVGPAAPDGPAAVAVAGGC